MIEDLFKNGKSFSNFPFKIIYIISENGYAPLQSGFAVSKKLFKKAVNRNKVKRLMKESYRLQKNTLKEKLVNRKTFMTVFFIYTAGTLPIYKDVSVKIKNALARLEKIIDENSDANS